MVLDISPRSGCVSLSLKAGLQVYLAQSLGGAEASKPWQGVPVTPAFSDLLRYQSAIALQQTGGNQPLAIALAQQWLRQLQKSDPTDPEMPNLLPWHWATTEDGRLVMTLADGDGLSWLAAIATYFTTLKTLPLPTATHLAPTGPPFLLCQAWQLSLADVLQWGQVWCGRRHQDLMADANLSAIDLSLKETELAQRFNQQGGWTAIPGTRKVVQAIAIATDRLAEHPDDRRTYLHQGYALTAAIAQMDAQCSLHHMCRLEPMGRIALSRLCAAAQALLQHLLFRAFNDPPFRTM